jgi:hypothetical protein
MTDDLKFVISLLILHPNRQFNKNKIGYLAAQNGFSLSKARSDPMFHKINLHRQKKPDGYYYEYWYISSHRRKEIIWLLRK